MSLFNDTDKRLLNKTLELREKIVDNYVNKKLPESSKDIDSLTNLLESIDRSILSRAKLKIEESNSKNLEETKQIMIDLVMNLHKSNNNNIPQETEKRNIELNIENNFNYRKEEFDSNLDTLTIEDFNKK